MYTCVSASKNKSCKNKSIKQDDLESYVIKQLKNIFFTDESIIKVSSELMKCINQYNLDSVDELKYLNAQRNSIKKKIDKAFDMYFDDAMDKELLHEKTNTLKSQLSTVELRINELEGKNYSWINQERLLTF